ncbi:glutathione S-transferase family protein [Iodidimonas sp. SYSU 1G8]|uniref:glutathione S-transferase family protein n=1 Tax=Iodidimonas sp. SYSU 1G8 TaxID=3133967 RepID=UPI0031FE6892
MKLYNFAAPNPQKVRIYAAEKGIPLELIDVDVLGHQLRTPEMLAKNPLAVVPFLELDDGTVIRESLVIIEYLEELHPHPPMLGTSPLERARIRELDRLAELGLMVELAHYVHNVSPFFADKGPQSSEAATMALNSYRKTLAVMDREIGERPFVAGGSPTVADCTLYSTLGFGDYVGVKAAEDFPNIVRWRAAFAARPSASA